MKKITLAILMLSNLSISTSVFANCEQSLKGKMNSALQLDYNKFDQTMNSGWRDLATNHCYKEAARLIEAYIEKNSADENSLKWHLFQMRAFSGNYKGAIELTNTILLSEEKAKSTKLLWNEYVLANVAFLENDIHQLKFQRDNIASKVDDHYGNSLNLNIIDNLINGLGKPYKQAYEGK